MPESRCTLYEHLAIESLKPESTPLPFTETGYRSHFLLADELNQYETPADYVRAWLDHEAAKPEWQTQKAKTAQFNLF